MNPMELLLIKNSCDTFVKNHPKFPMFLNAVYQNGLAEGNIIELSVKTTDGRTLETNLKLSSSDVELLQQLNDMFRNRVAVAALFPTAAVRSPAKRFLFTGEISC